MNTKNFLKASSILFIGEFLTRFIGFIYLKPLNSIDSSIGFISGIIMQPYSFFLVFAMLGLTNVLTIKLSESYNQPELYKKNFINGGLYILITSLLVTLILFIFAPSLITHTSGDISSILNLSPLINSLKILAFSIIFYAFNMLLKSTFFSQSKYTIVSITYVTEQLIKVGLLLFGCYLLLVKYNFNVEISAYVLSLSTLISIISTTAIMLIYGIKTKTFEHLKINSKYKFNIKPIYTLFILGAVYFFNGLFVTGFMQIDIFTISSDLQSLGISNTDALAIIGDYTTWSWKLISLVLSLGSVFITVMVKHLSERKDKTSSEFNYILNILLIYSLLATVFFLTAGKSFYYWFYANSTPMSIFILFSQSLLIPFYLLRIQMSVYAITKNRKKSIITSTILLFLLKIILNPICFHFFFILGYIISSIIAISISSLLLIHLNKKLFSFTRKEIFYKLILCGKLFITFISTLIISSVIFYIFHITKDSNFIKLIIQSLVLLTTFAVVLHKDIRKML